MSETCQNETCCLIFSGMYKTRNVDCPLRPNFTEPITNKRLTETNLLPPITHLRLFVMNEEELVDSMFVLSLNCYSIPPGFLE